MRCFDIEAILKATQNVVLMQRNSDAHNFDKELFDKHGSNLERHHIHCLRYRVRERV